MVTARRFEVSLGFQVVNHSLSLEEDYDRRSQDSLNYYIQKATRGKRGLLKLFAFLEGIERMVNSESTCSLFPMNVSTA